MADTRELFTSCREALEEITQMLYRQENKKAYIKLNPLLASLSNLIGLLFSGQGSSLVPSEEQEKVLQAVNGAMQAMEQNDGVLLADILQYEVMETLQSYI